MLSFAATTVLCATAAFIDVVACALHHKPDDLCQQQQVEDEQFGSFGSRIIIVQIQAKSAFL